MRDHRDIMIQFSKIIERHPEIYDHHSDAYKTRVVDSVWEKIADCVRTELKEDCTVEELKIKWKGIRSSFNRYKNKLMKQNDSNSSKKYYLYDTLKFLDPFTRPKGSQIESSIVEECGSNVSIGLNENSDLNSSSDWNDKEYKPRNEQDQIVHQRLSNMLTNEYTYCDNTRKRKYSSEDKSIDDERSNETLYINPSNDWNIKELKLHTVRNEQDQIVHQRLNNMLTNEYTYCDNTTKKKYSNEDKDDDNEDLQFFKSILPDIKNFTNKEKRKLKIGILRLIDDLENDKKQQ